MQLLLLHLDDALELQTEFVRSCLMAGASELNAADIGRSIRLWSRWPLLHSLAARLRQTEQNGKASEAPEPRLCFLGSGDFHHVSALLISMAAEAFGKPLTVIHFDNHPDWVRFSNGVHCGSWVNAALNNRLVTKVITVGVTSDDLSNPERKGADLRPLSDGRLELYPFHHPPSRVRTDCSLGGAGFDQRDGKLYWHSIADFGESAFVDHLLSRIATDAVYITVDKDVLERADAITNWDQGSIRLPFLLHAISEIGTHHRIIGADVIGDYSRPAYAGMPWTCLLKRAEVMIDQPRGRPDLARASDVNSAANLALLEVLASNM